MQRPGFISPKRFTIAALGCGLAILVAGCGVAAAPSTPTRPPATAADVVQVATGTPAATTSVAIQNFAFGPAVISVPVGATVMALIDVDF